MADSAGNLIVVLMTFPSQEDAQKIATVLVDEQLAACVSILPGVRSLFIWEGVRQEAAEVLAIVKTSRERFERLAARVRSLHPYTIPEIIGLPIVEGNAAYLKWVADAV
jgi:periplasmic divalent cation tolerance protein